MLVVPEQTYPLICVAVSKGTELNQVVRFGTVNPNSTSSWFTEAGMDAECGSVLLGLQHVVFRTEIILSAPHSFLPVQTRHRRV